MTSQKPIAFAEIKNSRGGGCGTQTTSDCVVNFLAEDNSTIFTATADQIVSAVNSYAEHKARIAQLEAALERAETLVSLLTIRQVIEGGDKAISAAGLNPWCMNEGKATGTERLSAHWIESALKQANA